MSDIRAKAEKLCAVLEAMPSEGNIAAVEEVLVQERERCAQAAHDFLNGEYGFGYLGSLPEDIAARIRSPDTDTTQERT